MKQYKRILCPLDFSDASQTSLAEAAGLAKGMGSTLCLLHAFQNPAYVLPMSGYVGPTVDMLAKIREQLGQELAAVAEPLRNEGIAVETLVLEGAPYDAIVDHAKEWKADLIVVCTHGRTGLSHALMGSVAERVVRFAPCPVLVTRVAGHS